MSENEWSDYSKKRLKHPTNPELVTGRVNIINERNVIRISIGKIISGLLDIKKYDRVSVAVHKQNKNLILISKSNLPHTYSLCENTSNTKKSNFLSVTFRYDFHEAFRLSQTIILEYDIGNEGILLVDIEKLKWRN